MEAQFGEVMSRRIGSLIPFVPFTREDCIAFVENEIDTFCIIYAKTRVKKGGEEGAVRFVGNFTFTAGCYDPHQGATSLKDCIKGKVADLFNEYHLKGENLEGTSGHFFLAGQRGN